MAQGPSAKDQTALDAVKTAKEAQNQAGRDPSGPASSGAKPQGSGDSPKPHGDPLKPVLEQ